MQSLTLQRQFKLWTVLLVLVPSVLTMAVYTYHQLVVVRQEKLALIEQRVGFQKQLIEYWLEERSNDVRNISRLAAFGQLDRAQMQNTLTVMQANNSDFDSLSYIDKDGYFQLSTFSGGIRFRSAAAQPYYQAAVAGREYISDIVIGRNSNRPIINFSAPVYDDGGRFQGLILGSVRTTTIERLLRENWMGETGEILLVNKEGVLVTEPRYHRVLIERGLSDPQARLNLRLSGEALQRIKLGEAGQAEWIDYLGQRVLGAYEAMPERQWTIVGSIGEAEIIAPIYAQLKLMLAGTLMLIVLLLPLAAYFTQLLKRPIEWLIEQANLVAREEYAAVGEGWQGGKMPRELRHLCDTFAAMSHKIEHTVQLLKEKEVHLASKIVEVERMNALLEEEIEERQSAQAALQALNDELEKKVHERTAQLQEINAVLEEEISERQAAQQVLEKLSVTDALTGLHNHGYIVEYLEGKMGEARAQQWPLSVAIFDLDCFKAINDTFGHVEGDNVLRAVAACLKEHIRETDTVGRYGGEEFVLILPRTPLQRAYELAERLRQQVSELTIGQQEIRVTMSGGVAEYQGESGMAFIGNADRKLYLAKATGRNRIVMEDAGQNDLCAWLHQRPGTL